MDAADVSTKATRSRTRKSTATATLTPTEPTPTSSKTATTSGKTTKTPSTTTKTSNIAEAMADLTMSEDSFVDDDFSNDSTGAGSSRSSANTSPVAGSSSNTSPVAGSSRSSANTSPVAGSSTNESPVAGPSGFKMPAPVGSETRRSSRVASNKKPTYATNKPKKPKLFDAQGKKTATGTDYCDCGDTKCPGCFFPCPNLKCLSTKCGVECRQNRNWEYDHANAIKESLPWKKQPIPKVVDLDK